MPLFLPADHPYRCFLCQQGHLVNCNRVQFFQALRLGQFVADEMCVEVLEIR